MGPQLLLSTFREEWWPLGGRNLTRSMVLKCIRCVRLIGRTFNPIMGNLPSERLTPGFPSSLTGTDYGNPVHIGRQGRGTRSIKFYIFLYYLLCYMHLELVTSLSTDGYLLCLKILITRRGKRFCRLPASFDTSTFPNWPYSHRSDLRWRFRSSYHPLTTL